MVKRADQINVTHHSTITSTSSSWQNFKLSEHPQWKLVPLRMLPDKQLVIGVVRIAVAEDLEAEFLPETAHSVLSIRLNVEGRLPTTRALELHMSKGIVRRGRLVDGRDDDFDVDGPVENLRRENRQFARLAENGLTVLLVDPLHGVIIVHEGRRHLDAIHGLDLQAARRRERALSKLLVFLHHCTELSERNRKQQIADAESCHGFISQLEQI
jgi:hypothetical protein